MDICGEDLRAYQKTDVRNYSLRQCKTKQNRNVAFIHVETPHSVIQTRAKATITPSEGNWFGAKLSLRPFRLAGRRHILPGNVFAVALGHHRLGELSRCPR